MAKKKKKRFYYESAKSFRPKKRKKRCPYVRPVTSVRPRAGGTDVNGKGSEHERANTEEIQELCLTETHRPVAHSSDGDTENQPLGNGEPHGRLG